MKTILLIITYPNNSRQLKNLIIGILKQGLAQNIKRINYIKSYSLKDNNIIKEEEKILIIKTDKTKELKLFLEKNHPKTDFELISTNIDL